MSNILHHITDKVIEIVMAKITDEHPFWKAVMLATTSVGMLFAIKYSLILAGRERFLHDATTAYGMLLLWGVACTWALPETIEDFDSKKWLARGWLLFALLVIAHIIWRVCTNNWDPLIP